VNDITSITDNLNPGRNQTFAYDPDYRLTQASGLYGPTEYSYDGVGNRLTRTAQNVTESYAYFSTAIETRAIE
jgi:YD repeat-containing protein